MSFMQCVPTRGGYHHGEPNQLPKALIEPNLRRFPSSRKRVMTSLEAAEEGELKGDVLEYHVVGGLGD